MNIREMVAEIHANAEREKAGSGRSLNGLRGSPVIGQELASLHGAFEKLYQMRGLVGQMPSAPDTLRARIGARIVRLVQRLLFWYTPQINRVQHEVTTSIGCLCRLVEMQMEMIGRLSTEVRALQCSQQPSSQLAEETRGIPPAFEFALQDHFRGSEGETRSKLEEWRRAIQQAGGNAAGGWLDIGCGRGEWLGLLAEHGHAACGIDANPVAVDHCAGLGLRAEQGFAIEHLNKLPDGSLGVVTMFHVVEHLPVEYLLELFPLIVRKLRPGGLVAIETPNPGNLMMGSNHFWNDPTHRRPVPEALLTFMLEFAGFAVIRSAGLNPFPPENHLPWTELDVVRRIDSLLFDARDYGLLGRK